MNATKATAHKFSLVYRSPEHIKGPFALHAAGCGDIKREREGVEVALNAVTLADAKAEAHEEANADFIREGSSGWPIHVNNCCKKAVQS